MKWQLIGVLFAVASQAPVPSADACGVKLTVSSPPARKAVARSSNPSDVLVVGSPPPRLERDLNAAGHRVEVAPSVAAAKKTNYAVVVVEAPAEAEARSRFPESRILVRRTDVAATEHDVESSVARAPVRAQQPRDVIAARPAREPIAAGPPQEDRVVVAAKQEPAEPAPAPSAPAISAQPTAPSPEPQRKPAKVGSIHGEVYFAIGQPQLDSRQTAQLDKSAKWLASNPGVSIVVEGHADPTGSPESNLALGQKRAEAVRDYLVSAGVGGDRVDVISYGDTRLRYGRADGRNRRAAIVVK